MITNELSAHKTVAEKEAAFKAARKNGERAWRSNGRSISLKRVRMENVEYIAGLWRVQNPFPYEIQHVRNADFVLHDKLPNKEKNLFEFYKASQVCCNCYGYFMVPESNKIVAKYTTDAQTYWSYGNSIEQARAFLGIRLYDEYMDLIHSAACQNCAQRQKK